MMFAIIIPVYGQQHFTHDVLDDLWLDASVQANINKVFVVDNKGDYEQRHDETVFRAGENLGWCGGTNYGLARSRYDFNYYDAFICLNNDVRLSPNFLPGIRSALEAKPLAGLMAPLYDDVWEQQKTDYRGPASEFKPKDGEDEVQFVDGTCMVIPFNTIEKVGFLDDQNFGEYGWGADFDYAYRVREAGAKAFVTHRAYLNHLHQGTAKTLDDNWNGLAGNEMEVGMTAKYGSDWRAIVF